MLKMLPNIEIESERKQKVEIYVKHESHWIFGVLQVGFNLIFLYVGMKICIRLGVSLF